MVLEDNECDCCNDNGGVTLVISIASVVGTTMLITSAVRTVFTEKMYTVFHFFILNLD